MDSLQIRTMATPSLPDLSHKLDGYQAPVVQPTSSSGGRKVDFNAIIGLLGTFLGGGGSASAGSPAGSSGSNNLDLNAIILADAQQSASNRQLAYLLIGSLLVVFVIIAVVFLQKSK